jgi:hypothetical protein
VDHHFQIFSRHDHCAILGAVEVGDERQEILLKGYLPGCDER